MSKQLGLLVGGLLLVASLLGGHTDAQNTASSSWLKPAEPSLTTLKSDVPFAQLPAHSNKSCQPNTKFITIPQNILKIQTETSLQGCAIQTAFGTQNSTDGLTKLHDTDISGPVKSAAGNNLILTAIPASKHIMYSSSTLNGFYLSSVKDFAKNSKITTQPNGSIYHQLNQGVAGSVIKDSTGTPLVFADSRFSDNGQWMIGEIPFRGMTRVNIETSETLTFGPPYNHNTGLKPKFVSAISGDGRYAITAENTYEVLKIYDLSTCKPNADPTKTAACQSKDLLPFMRSSLHGFKYIHHAQFSANHSIRLYAQYTGADGKDRYGFYLITAAGEKESLLDYLALGDSFASGEGAFSYKAGTDIQTPFNKCHLSSLSYPYLLGAKSSINSVHSVACSGARIKDIYLSGSGDYSSSQKQSDGKESAEHDNEIYSNFLVGYRQQTDFVSKNKPTHVTLSISGNDIGFGKILLACLMPGTCYETSQERLNLVHTINSQYDNLVSIYLKMKDEAGSTANIYALGYPSLADSTGNCALNVHLNQQEIIFSNQIVSYLNSIIKRAADKAGVRYIDVENAFVGHRLCEARSSNVAVHGLTAGDDKTFSIPIKPIDLNFDIYLTGRESYHPNLLGHSLFSQVIGSATNNFTAANPAADLSLTNPTNVEAAQLLNTHALSLQPRKIIFEDGLLNNIVKSGQNVEFEQSNLQPLSEATVWLGAEQSKLGNYRVSSSGDLESSLVIPNNLKPQLHTIHIYAKNQAGEDVDIQKTIYVAASDNDIDSDGIQNSQERCLLIAAANQDQDEDGVDDACDGQIDNAPIRSTNSPAATSHSLSIAPTENTEQSPLESESQNFDVPTSRLIDYVSLFSVLGTQSPAMSPQLTDQVASLTKTSTHRLLATSSLNLWPWLVIGLSLLLATLYVVIRKQKSN